MAKFKRIVFDAGHGAGDPGAIGYGDSEEQTMIGLSNALTKAFKNAGIKVYQIGNNRNTYKEGYYRTTNEIYTTDAILELHRDASSNSSASGASVLISSSYPADDVDNGCASALKEYFGSNDFRGIIQRNDLANMNYCASRGFNYRLLETGFITNAEENALLDSTAEYEKLANLILDKIGYLFEGYQEASSNISTSDYTRPVITNFSFFNDTPSKEDLLTLEIKTDIQNLKILFNKKDSKGKYSTAGGYSSGSGLVTSRSYSNGILKLTIKAGKFNVGEYIVSSTYNNIIKDCSVDSKISNDKTLEVYNRNDYMNFSIVNNRFIIEVTKQAK